MNTNLCRHHIIIVTMTMLFSCSTDCIAHKWIDAITIASPYRSSALSWLVETVAVTWCATERVKKTERWRNTWKQVWSGGEKCQVWRVIKECQQKGKKRCIRWWWDQRCYMIRDSGTEERGRAGGNRDVVGVVLSDQDQDVRGTTNFNCITMQWQ